jgi:hypothetical protein
MKLSFSYVPRLAQCAAGLIAAAAISTAAPHGKVQRVLLISIDGMHALDFENCTKGVASMNYGTPYCPNLADLRAGGIDYTHAFTSKPSDSFPGSGALATGGLPATIGMYYDVSYDRALSPPAQTTPYGIPGGRNLCPSVVGTPVGFDEEIDRDLTKLDGGGGINPAYLPRDPNNGCAPVYPHQFIRVNTVFEVVKAHGGYTAWSDKHPAYDFYNGPSGHGVDDFYSPEINSVVVPLPHVSGCATIRDPDSDLTAWTNSFENIKCYDKLKVGVIVNEISGRTHDGKNSAPVPTLFGMNFQAVSVGQKLVEHGVAGGYKDALGTPSANLLSEIEFVDREIGAMITALKENELYDSTLIVITAKHGQSPIDPNRVLRIPADNPNLESPATLLGSQVAAASEDDVSLIWLNHQSNTAEAAKTISENGAKVGAGEVYAGPSLTLFFDDPAVDPRTPDIAVLPNYGVIYTGGKKKVAEHGGFSHDDTNVMLLLANPQLQTGEVEAVVQTTSVAPTILNVLGISPSELQAVRKDKTTVLPGVAFSGSPLN